MLHRPRLARRRSCTLQQPEPEQRRPASTLHQRRTLEPPAGQHAQTSRGRAAVDHRLAWPPVASLPATSWSLLAASASASGLRGVPLGEQACGWCQAPAGSQGHSRGQCVAAGQGCWGASGAGRRQGRGSSAGRSAQASGAAMLTATAAPTASLQRLRLQGRLGSQGCAQWDHQLGQRRWRLTPGLATPHLQWLRLQRRLGRQGGGPAGRRAALQL